LEICGGAEAIGDIDTEVGTADKGTPVALGGNGAKLIGGLVKGNAFDGDKLGRSAEVGELELCPIG
jgi:hypothetical protein